MRSKSINATTQQALDEQNKKAIQDAVEQLTAPIQDDYKMTAEDLCKQEMQNVAKLAYIAVIALPYDKNRKQEKRIVENKFYEACEGFMQKYSDDKDKITLMRKTAIAFAHKGADDVEGVSRFTASRRIGRMEKVTRTMLENKNINIFTQEERDAFPKPSYRVSQKLYQATA